MAASPPPPIMKGGAREHILEILMKYSKPIQIYILLALSLSIIFVKEIPVVIRAQAGTHLGRLFLFLLTLVIADYYSWANGLLMAILTLLLLSLSPRPTTEGFHAMDDTLKLVDTKRKWWVEQVLKENPVGIQEETVKTSAIQDNTSSQTNVSSQR